MLSLVYWYTKLTLSQNKIICIEFLCFLFFKRMVKMTKRFSNAGDGTNGAFMGFDTSESDDTETSDLEQGDRHFDDVSNMLACDLQHMS